MEEATPLHTRASVHPAGSGGTGVTSPPSRHDGQQKQPQHAMLSMMRMLILTRVPVMREATMRLVSWEMQGLVCERTRGLIWERMRGLMWERMRGLIWELIRELMLDLKSIQLMMPTSSESILTEMRTMEMEMTPEAHLT